MAKLTSYEKRGVELLAGCRLRNEFEQQFVASLTERAAAGDLLHISHKQRVTLWNILDKYSVLHLHWH